MAGPSATVLCIDDSDIGLALLSDLLEFSGYAVLTADSGADGLKLIANRHVDAVVLDYHMPDMDGGEVAREIRRSWPDVPIMLFTGCVDEVPEAVQNAVDSALSKDEPVDVLLRQLRSLTAGIKKPSRLLERIRLRLA